jgi:cysteine desulfurase
MIYLDSNATTRPSEAVREAARRANDELWANPSSVHRAGQEAKRAVELARASCAEIIGARARQITLTSGGTESIDLGIRGVLDASPRPVLVTTPVEHAAIRLIAEYMRREGAAEVRICRVDSDGLVDIADLDRLIDESVSLVSVQWVNNETGVVQPVERVGEICRSRGVRFHCDATQGVGKLPVSAEGLGADLLSYAPHKFHGPKGVGALWVRRGFGIRPRILGSQEIGRRGGTENVPAIVGAGAACEESVRWLADESNRRRLASMRDRLEQTLLESIPGAVVNGAGATRIWNTISIGFPPLEAEALLILLSEQGVCVGAGSACSSGSLDPSPVLLAMGVPEAVAHASIRISLSRDTTEDEITEAARRIIGCARALAG